MNTCMQYIIILPCMHFYYTFIDDCAAKVNVVSEEADGSGIPSK